MRNVSRIQEPLSFKSKARGWTQNLLRKIKNEGKASNYYYDRYNQKNTRTIRDDMTDSLLKMYDKMCCYCEAKTSKIQGEIEHLKPKKKFPHKTYDWNNLHWACSICNGIKLEKYDDQNPILDPSDIEPINEHIELEIDEEMNWMWMLNKNNSARSYTTIEHTCLNREDLKTARMKIFLRTIKLIMHVKTASSPSQKLNLEKETLKNLYLGEFGFVTAVRKAFETTSFRYEEL